MNENVDFENLEILCINCNKLIEEQNISFDDEESEENINVFTCSCLNCKANFYITFNNAGVYINNCIPDIFDEF